MADVALENISKYFDSVEVVHEISLEVSDGEFVVFVGPSGCGKSTLLRMIAGLEEVTCGTIKIDGQVVNDLPPAKREIAMVFQSYALYPHKTVRQNIGFGLRMAKLDKATIEKKVLETARLLELEDLLDRKPRQLSGGQRQRIAIGRAIVRNPRLFLFDEPLSNLDAALRGQMRIEIARLHQSLGTTMVYVTHDQVEAMTLADKIVVLNKGRIEQIGTPLELYTRPANLFVAGFIGSPKMNFIEGEVHSTHASLASISLATNGTFDYPLCGNKRVDGGEAITAGIRPEDLSLGTDGITFEGQAQVVEHLGAETHVIVALANGGTLTASVNRRAVVDVGDQLSLCVPIDCVHLFNGDGIAIEKPKPL